MFCQKVASGRSKCWFPRLVLNLICFLQKIYLRIYRLHSLFRIYFLSSQTNHSKHICFSVLVTLYHTFNCFWNNPYSSKNVLNSMYKCLPTLGLSWNYLQNYLRLEIFIHISSHEANYSATFLHKNRVHQQIFHFHSFCFFGQFQCSTCEERKQIYI